MHSRFLPSVGTAFVAAVVSFTVLGGCTPSAHQTPPSPKPVKTEVVGAALDATSTNSFVGTLRAKQRADLGFEGTGRVSTIQVEVGDRVRAGQILARLDDAPARWRLDKAEADRTAAAATLTERQTQLQQQEALARDKIISATALESARAAHQLARSQLEAANSAVATARRELTLTRITAPFDGEIVGRLAQPFSDVSPGQTILQIQAGSELEVVAMLPESVAASLSPGDSARGRINNEAFALSLERLSARSDNGSLVQAIFRVPRTSLSPQKDASKLLRSGGVVSVDLPSRPASLPITITLPASAAIPAAQPGQATVFVLDSNNKLQLRKVHISSVVLQEGRVGITEGLKAGERVVVAGTAFLHEGQLAVAHRPQTILHGTGEGSVQ